MEVIVLKRVCTYFAVVLLLLTNMNVTVFAADGKNGELSKWKFATFGNGASDNPEPKFNDDGSVTLEAKGGKISSSVDGISMLYQTIPVDTNFEFSGKATIHKFSANNQVSFGLMLRDEMGEHRSSDGHESNYVSVGALDQSIKGFYKLDNQKKLNAYDEKLPVEGSQYDLKIKKTGDVYVLYVNGEIIETLSLENIFSDNLYAGMFVARDTEVTFSQVTLSIDDKKVKSLKVDSSEMKKDYLVNEKLDISGLKVSAIYSDGRSEKLSEGDYVITGFDSSKPGTITIKIDYNGVTESLELNILELTITDLSIQFHPAKTTYYLGDSFDPQGLVVNAVYNDGFKTATLSKDEYHFEIEGNKINLKNFRFNKAGKIPVRIVANENPKESVSFHVQVQEEQLSDLRIHRKPLKTMYFLGDELDLAGLQVFAKYGEKNEILLTNDEYSVSGFDSSTSGKKELIIEYRGKTANFTVTVKEKESQGIKIVNYPKTTYTVGEEFDENGLVVGMVFDNGDQKELSPSDYTLDSRKFNSQKPGTYMIQIIPKDRELDPIQFKVTVREKATIVWKKIQFGQSSSAAKNYMEDRKDGSVRIVAEEGGGKVTGDHDGIAFYYTELDAENDNFKLSADIKVNKYAKTPHDGQESFGIMARDAIGKAGDSSVFSSNIAAIGGFSGGTKAENGTQLFVRTGVLSSDGEGSQGIQKIMLSNERPNENNTNENYRLTLSKTNSGFTGQLNNGEEVILYEPDILNVQDGKMYVGFYAARLADIEVSNIELTISDAATDPPKVEAPAEAITPNLEILSLNKTSVTDYMLRVRANVDGLLVVKEGKEEYYDPKTVTAGEVIEIPTEIPAGQATPFSITFYPDDTQYLTSYDKIVSNFTVQMKTYQNGKDIYVASDGSSVGDGSKEHPLDLDTAIDFVQPGQRILVKEGTYKRSTKLEIKKYNDGKKDAMKYLVADPDAKTRPIIDFDKQSEGVVHSGNYWHVKGINFTRSAADTKGYTVGGSHNTIENVWTYEHGDTGLQISRTDSRDNDISKWPSHNLILNSISFENRDPSENNADGFAAKLTVGEGNVFRGTIAFNNIDDGWDLYTKVGTGAIGAVTIENSIALNNGFYRNGEPGAGDKNGFKLGGEGIHVPHVIKNSLAIGNGALGFTSNSNPGVIAINNISVNNGTNLSFTTYSDIETDFTIDAFVSLQTNEDKGKKDQYPQELASSKNYFFDGEKTNNRDGEPVPEELVETIENFIQQFSDSKVEKILNAEGEIQWGNLWTIFAETILPTEEEPQPGKKDPTPEEPDDNNPGPKDPNENLPNDRDGEQTTPNDKVAGDKKIDHVEKSNKNLKTDNKEKPKTVSIFKLPNTATNIYTLLAIGIVFLLMGATYYFILRRKKAKKV